MTNNKEYNEIISLKPHERLGPIARQLCYIFNGWIVGGAVDYISGTSKEKPKDIDIVISIERWREAAFLIPEGSVANKFGGFKFKDGDFIVDVWQDDINHIAVNYEKFKAYYPQRNIKIGRVL